jgi:hypothetical protein
VKHPPNLFDSFVDHYLRLLDFPARVAESVEKGDINLFKAQQLARLTADRLGIASGPAKVTRAELRSFPYVKEGFTGSNSNNCFSPSGDRKGGCVRRGDRGVVENQRADPGDSQPNPASKRGCSQDVKALRSR